MKKMDPERKEEVWRMEWKRLDRAEEDLSALMERTRNSLSIAELHLQQRADRLMELTNNAGDRQHAMTWLENSRRSHQMLLEELTGFESRQKEKLRARRGALQSGRQTEEEEGKHLPVQESLQASR